MTSKEGRDLVLGSRVAEVLKRAHLGVKAVEVWSIPRPTGGNGLCVNFLVTEPGLGSRTLTAVSERVRLLLAYVVRQGISTEFTSLQFGFSVANSELEKPRRGGRFFFESSAVRQIEKDPTLLESRSLDELVTVKDLDPTVAPDSFPGANLGS